jgi:adenosylcobinamide kinase/adenosylcobinamide-phosphate guanylyltransferase
MKRCMLLIGGARSGKTRRALEIAQPFARKAYIATAQALDPEMQERIARHRQERGPSFATFEVPLALAETLRKTQGNFDCIVVDCLTLWLANLMLSQERNIPWEEEVRNLADTAKTAEGLVIFVTNEVGMGIVPGHELGRHFRDAQGLLNQSMAQVAHEVIFMTAGIPLTLKNEVAHERSSLLAR